MWQGREHVDPLKESAAQATKLTSFTTTLADEYARNGQDWETQLRQRAKEIALMQELGLTINQTLPQEQEDDVDETEEAATEA
jgi:capsid protein